MLLAILTSAAALAAPGGLTVPPPPGLGPWRQLGPAVSSRAGKQMHFFRTATPYPAKLAVVAVSTSTRPIRLHWWSYCEFLSDDEQFQEHQQTVVGVHSVVGYPPVFDGATLCYVSVYTNATPGAAVTAGVFTG